jgi:hypothetical protein
MQYGIRAEISLSPEGHGKGDLANGVTVAPGTMPWKGAQLGHRRDLDNPIWLKVLRNRMFKELPPSTRTQSSLTSLTMG